MALFTEVHGLQLDLQSRALRYRTRSTVLAPLAWILVDQLSTALVFGKVAQTIVNETITAELNAQGVPSGLLRSGMREAAAALEQATGLRFRIEIDAGILRADWS